MGTEIKKPDSGIKMLDSEKVRAIGKLILAGDEDGVRNALEQDRLRSRVKENDPYPSSVAYLATEKDLDPSKPLPDGSMLVLYEGPATGHGKRPYGHMEVYSKLDVSGKIPAKLDKYTLIWDRLLMYFGAGEGLRYTETPGGRVSLELKREVK